MYYKYISRLAQFFYFLELIIIASFLFSLYTDSAPDSNTVLSGPDQFLQELSLLDFLSPNSCLPTVSYCHPRNYLGLCVVQGPYFP